MRPPVAGMPFWPSAEMTEEEWEIVRRQLCRWHVAGCAAVAGLNGMLDVATLATVTAEQLDGARLLVYHRHVVGVWPAN